MTSDPQPEGYHSEANPDKGNTSNDIVSGQPHTGIGDEPPKGENAEPYKKKGYFARYRQWRDNPWRSKASWTDKAIVFLTLGIVFLGFMQWLEMRGSEKQTNKIITAANLIETHQKQLVLDNKQVLDDNRLALDKSLSENRVELGNVLKQNREALQAQTAASNGQLAAIQSQTEASERPWITIDTRPASPLTYSGDELAITFDFTPKNIGRSPAEHVWVDARLVPGLDFEEWKTQQDKMCAEKGTQERIREIPSGYTVFPGDPPIPQPTGLQLHRAELDSFWKAYPPQVRGTLFPVGLVGCGSYTYGASPIVHTTRFMYELMRQGQGGSLVIDLRNAPIPAETLRLSLIPIAIGSYAAD
jgi:ElaB/YqjD/DUF883 family membrane-anchored ribosome-binding protein